MAYHKKAKKFIAVAKNQVEATDHHLALTEKVVANLEGVIEAMETAASGTSLGLFVLNCQEMH